MSSPIIDDRGRPEPPTTANELQTLLGFLDFQRATLQWKAVGLGDEQLCQPLSPSTMTLGGLLSHLAFVEDYWFGYVLSQTPPAEPWRDMDWDADPDAEWHRALNLPADQVRAEWRDAVAQSRRLVAGALERGGLDAAAQRGDSEFSLRWILVHMIEEYSRHNGHADLLRENIDGLTGE